MSCFNCREADDTAIVFQTPDVCDLILDKFKQLSSAVSSAKFRGTATDSDTLGGVAAASYLRSNANDTTSGSFGVLNDSGITLGAGSDVTLTLSSDNLTIANTTQDKNIIITVIH